MQPGPWEAVEVGAIVLLCRFWPNGQIAAGGLMVAANRVDWRLLDSRGRDRGKGTATSFLGARAAIGRCARETFRRRAPVRALPPTIGEA